MRTTTMLTTRLEEYVATSAPEGRSCPEEERAVQPRPPASPMPSPCRRRRAGAAVGVEVTVEGRTLRLTNLDKVLYPHTGFTKGDLIGYYAAVAPVLLPHLRDRPLTLKRYPTASRASTSTRSSVPRIAPSGCRRRPSGAGAPSARSTTACARTCRRSCGSATSPTWSCTPRCRTRGTLERPTTLAFDLDPGPPGGHRAVLRGRARCCATCSPSSG